nr:MAG TPA: antirepressor [Caudoviricetes sp.]
MRVKAEIKVENWADHNIRFVWKDGEWWGVLKDICDALGLQTFHVKERLENEYGRIKGIVSNNTLSEKLGRSGKIGENKNNEKCIKGVVSNDLLAKITGNNRKTPLYKYDKKCISPLVSNEVSEKIPENTAKNDTNKNEQKCISRVVSNDLCVNREPELSSIMIPTPSGEREHIIANELAIYDAIFMSRKKEAKVFRRWVYNMLRTLRQKSGFEGFEVFRMMDKEQQKEAMRKMRDEIQSTRELTRQDYIKANTIADKAVSNRAGLPTMMHKGDMSPDMLKDRQPILDDVVEIMSFKERFGLDISVSDTVYRKWGGEEDRGE